MKKLLLSFLLFFFLTSQASAAVESVDNYTLILNYGQSPYQTGYLAGRDTGWSFWDTSGLQQKNLITLYILNNTQPVSGLSPPAFYRTDERYHGANNYSWKCWSKGNYTNGVNVWHILDNYNTQTPAWKDIKLEESGGILARLISLLKSLFSIQTNSVNLSFWTWYELADDAGYVKISTDRGYTWTTLATYTGDSNGWVMKSIDLSDYTGREVLIAFNFISNTRNTAEGWYIDDILIQYNNEVVFSDDADTPPPRLTATLTYPVYDAVNNTRTDVNRSVELVEDYAHSIYYGYFFYTGGEYTGEYTLQVNTTINSTYLSAETSFNTTLWGCQQRGCHDAWTPPENLSDRNPTTTLHPDNITSSMTGNCLTMCHGTYTSQFLTASPLHPHEIKYGHLGGFMKNDTGERSIYNSASARIEMRSDSVSRHLSQTAYNQSAHLTLNCTDCHTLIVNASGSLTHELAAPQVLTGYNIEEGGVHRNLTCTECHGTLAYPTPAAYTLSDSFNYTPLFTGFEALTNTYIINVTGSLNLTVTGDATARFALTLIGPVDSTGGLQDLDTTDKWRGSYFIPSTRGEAFFNSTSTIYYQLGYQAYPATPAPLQSGTWILRIYNLADAFNYTITSNMPLARKPVITIPYNCSKCHNPDSSYPGAKTYQPVPEWDHRGAAYTHTDFNNDTRDDLACRACHGSLHSITIEDCRGCHPNPPSAAGHLQQPEYSSAPLSKCLGCHADPHLAPENAGGPDCISCHGLNGTAVHRIDENAAALGVHAGLNSEAANSTDVPAANKKCWACHTSTGAEPSDMGDRYSNPYRCLDCHNGSRYDAPVVREHYAEGEDITASPASNTTQSCINCHNLQEMKVASSEDDPYSTGLSLASHYAMKRWDIINSTDYCYYCHRNTSTAFPFEVESRKYITHGLDCEACHGSGRIHDANLSLPGMSDDNTLCLNCHSTLPNKTITEAFEGSAHKNLRCTDCHTPRRIFNGIIVDHESHTHNFTIPENATWLNATLTWSSGSSLGLTLQAPDATTYQGARVNISMPQSGNWTAVVRDLEGDTSYTLTLNVTMAHPGYTPKECETCHVEGFGTAPLVYRHLPNRSIVPTNTTCAECHSKGVSASTAMIAASHYLQKPSLDTADCVRCHLGVVEGWGSPPDPRNHTRYAIVNRTLTTKVPWRLVDNYSLTLIEATREGALFQFERDGRRLRRELVSQGDVFKYEVTGIAPGKTAVVNLTVERLFTPDAVEVSGYVLASRIHRETENRQCYACHDSEYRPGGVDYYVLKRDSDNVTLARMPVNFTETQTVLLHLGETWNLPENYSLRIAEVNLKRGGAQLALYRGDVLLEEGIVNLGGYFTHEEWVEGRRIAVFTARLDAVFAGSPPSVVLSSVRLLAGEEWILPSTYRLTQQGTRVKYLPLDSNITLGEEPENFHVYTLTPGGYSPDCLSCHAEGGVAPVKIDVEAFRTGVHAGLNANASHTALLSSELSKACWACHGNHTGGEPPWHPTPYLGNHTPKTCEYCHVYDAFGAPRVYSHYQGAEVSTNATCAECHSNTVQGRDNGNLQAAVSHYTRREGLVNTSDCSVCHNNKTNAPKWGGAPQVQKHLFNNTCTTCHAGEGLKDFHQKGITVTRRCESCHITGAERLGIPQVQTHYPGAPPGRANTLKNQYTCRLCHNATNATLHTSLIVREYENQTMGYCFQCHSTEGRFPYKPEVQIEYLRHGSGIRVKSGCESCHDPAGVSKFHTPTLVSKNYFSGSGNYKLECTQCHERHEEREYQPFKGIPCTDCHSEYGAAHYAGAQITRVNKTRTCKLCHNREAEVFHNLTHIAGNVSEAAFEPCYTCHAEKDLLEAREKSAGLLGGTMLAANLSDEPVITCTSCHNATGRSRFHYDPYPLGSVQNPGWRDWKPGNVTSCKDCHTYHGGAPPFNATNMGATGRSPSGTAHGFAPNCTICHGGADPISFHSLAATEFIPRVGVTLEPASVSRGETALLRVSVVLPPLMKVTRAEYFIDEIGVNGSGKPLNYILGASSDSSAILGDVVNTSQLSYGRHLIFVHVRDSAGVWSRMEIAVLTVRKEKGFQVVEAVLKEGMPAVILAGLLFVLWRRFR